MAARNLLFRMDKILKKSNYKWQTSGTVKNELKLEI